MERHERRLLGFRRPSKGKLQLDGVSGYDALARRSGKGWLKYQY